MKFDINAARTSGYSDDEIADYLAKENSFDLGAALKSGYSASEVVGFLSQSNLDSDKPVFDTAAETASLAARYKAPETFKMPDKMGIIQRAGEALRPKFKSVLENYVPTPQEQQADVDRRLSYGAGPISSKTQSVADSVRSSRGQMVSNDPTINKVVKAMNESGDKSFADIVDSANRPEVVKAARDLKADEYRSAGEWAADTLFNLSQGAVGLVQLPINIISPSSEISASLNATQKALRAQESEVLKAQREQLRERVQNEDGFFDKYAATVVQLVTSPALGLSEAVKQVPNFLGVIAAARLAGSLAAGSVGVAGRVSPTVALGEAISGGAIQAGARAAGTTAGGAGASMVMAGGDAAGGVYEKLTNLRETPLSVWEKNPDYQELLANGKSSKDAIEEIATTKARIAALVVAPLGLLGFMGAEAAIASRGLGRATAEALTVAGAGKMLAKDLIGEQLEEGGTQFGGNVVSRTVDPRQKLLEGVPEAMATALVTSAPFSAAGAASQFQEARAAQKPDYFAERQAVDLFDVNNYDPSLISPAQTARGEVDVGPSAPINFTPVGAPTQQAGLVDVVVPTAPETTDVSTLGATGGQIDFRSPAGSDQLGGGLGIPGLDAAGTGVLGGQDAGLLATNAGQAIPAGSTAGQLAPGVALPRVAARSTDQDLLARTEAALAAQENNNAVVQPVEQWVGRKGDGYATQADASQAISGRQRMFPTLDWKVEEMPSGKFRLAGYEQQSTQLDTPVRNSGQEVTSVSQLTQAAPIATASRQTAEPIAAPSGASFSTAQTATVFARQNGITDFTTQPVDGGFVIQPTVVTAPKAEATPAAPVAQAASDTSRQAAAEPIAAPSGKPFSTQQTAAVYARQNGITDFTTQTVDGGFVIQPTVVTAPKLEATPVAPAALKQGAAEPIAAPSGKPFSTQQTAAVFAQQNGIASYSTVKMGSGWVIKPTEKTLGTQTPQTFQGQTNEQQAPDVSGAASARVLQPLANGSAAQAQSGGDVGVSSMATGLDTQTRQPGALSTPEGAATAGINAPLKLAPPAPLRAVGRALVSIKASTARPATSTQPAFAGINAEVDTAPLTEQQQAGSAVARLLGRTVTYLKADAPESMPNGFMLPGDNKNIFIANDSDDAPLSVAMHEIYHTLPEAQRKALNVQLSQYFRQDRRAEFADQFRYDPQNDALLDEEIPAFMVQAISKREDFWQDLRTKMGNAEFSEVAKTILTKLNTLISGAKNDYGDEFVSKYITDVAKARDLLSTAYTEAMQAQGLKPDAATTASSGGIQASERAKSSEPAEPVSAEPVSDTPPAPSAPATPVDAASLDNTLKLAQGQVWQRGRDLKMAMQQRVLDAAMASGLDVTADNPETRKYLREIGVRDALSALRQNANAIGWYDLKTRQALAVMSLVHPEIAKNQDARFALTWAMAVTSNGLKVGKNFELAEKVYDTYKKTGSMPTNIGIGTAGEAINKSLGQFNELRATWGMDNLRQFMQTDFTVSEITGISPSLKPGGEHADVTVKGAAILGPKIGNGFFSNLYGNFDSLTMDRWLVRTWGRWTGTLIKPMPEQTTKARDRLTTSINAVVADQAEAKRLGDLVDLPITSDTALDALATAVQVASMDPDIRSKLNESELGLELRKAGNSLAKYLDGQKEAPQGPTERKFIRAIFGDVLADLQQRPEYKDLTMADLQAVLWYAEKRLYETAKEDPNADEDIEGYSDDEAPDYANAAADVARQKGVADKRIKAVLKKEERNERPTRARPANEQGAQGQTPGAGQPRASGGFTRQEKRKFIGERAVLRSRANRASDAQQSQAYSGDGGENGGRVRVLKDLGVSYTQKWKASRELSTVFRANSISVPTFVELAPTSQNAEQFEKAIADNKAKHPFGAAVFVYPAQDYQDMRLFLAEDGQSGVAVKPDGDIVSVFSTGGAGRAVMELAVAAGGRKLDAFETILPEFYAPHGFRAVARTKWNDDFAPEGWSKDAFNQFNDGQPDVVFMVYDPAKADAEYSPKDGKVMTGEDGYDQAVARQNREMKKVGKSTKASAVETPMLSNRAKPEFYSQLERTIANVPAKLATQPASQWALWLDSNGPKQGVKKDELEWSGIKDYLTLRGKDKVTSADLQAYLEEGGVRVEETMLGDIKDFSAMDEAQLVKEYTRIRGYKPEANGEQMSREEIFDELEGMIDEDADDTKYSKYQLPGGENYRELLITLPMKTDALPEPKGEIVEDGKDDAYPFAIMVNGEEENRSKTREAADGILQQELNLARRIAENAVRLNENWIRRENKGSYKSSHWDQKNVLAHIRVNDRVDADGKRILFVEEVQSDWGQQGRDEGFAKRVVPNTGKFSDTGYKWRIEGTDNVFVSKENAENVAKRGVLAAPFVTKTEGWLNLSLKRIAMLAVDGGYDKVAFVNGEQSADRYDLSKQVNYVQWNPGYSSGRKLITLETSDGKELGLTVQNGIIEDSSIGADGKRLDEVLGKEVADKILAKDSGDLRGLDLKMGGQGMLKFYNEIVPQTITKLLPKLGGEKMGAVEIELPSGLSERNRGAFQIEQDLETPFEGDVTLRRVMPNGDVVTIGVMPREDAYSYTENSENFTSQVITQQGFDVTDKMREIVGQGLPMFSNRAAPETTEFKKWFGDSKVVDENGEPLVVYHGTYVREKDGQEVMGNITAFDRMVSVNVVRRPASIDTVGNWFSTNPGEAGAEMYGNTIYPVYLSIKNPQVTTFELMLRRARLLQNGKDDGRMVGQAEVDAYRKWLMAMGKDGIKIEGNSSDSSTEFDGQDAWITLEPNQIKSAIGNDGSFDGANPNITASNRRQKLSTVGQNYTLPKTGMVDSGRIKLQDDALRMKRVIEAVKAKGGTVGEAQNFYDANTLMPGRVQASMDDFRDNVMSPLIKKAVGFGIDLDELALYAYAKHAQERNAYIASINKRMPDGGSGMTDAHAISILQLAKVSGDEAKFEELHKDLMAITASTRQIMLAEGLITQDEFDALDGAYENYIPLRGLENVDENSGAMRPGVGRGINVRGGETIKALGRKSQAGDLIENVIRDYQRVIMRVEKNDVGKVLLDFVLSNPDPDLWGVDVERSKPSLNKSTGLVQYTKGIEKGEDTIGVKVGGEQVYIKLADADLVRAIRQAWKDETSGLERATLAATGWWNNWMRNVLTRYNPAFAAINIPRDALWSGTSAALAELGPKGLAKYLANYGKALMASTRQEAGVSGTANKIIGNQQMDQQFQEFRNAGAITGGFYMRSLEDINTDLRNEMLLAGAKAKNTFEAIKSLPPYKLATLTARMLEFMGSASENATRFALYQAAREVGRTPAQAALLAKDGTTNFNRKGEWGGALNNMYLFFNAGVQGTAQLVKVLKNPAVQASMAGVTGVGVMLALYGASSGGEDDDGEAYWDKVPGYVKERNLVFMLPPGDALADGIQRAGKRGRYFTVPVQYGFNIFPNAGYMMADVYRNAQDPKRGVTPTKAALHMTSTVFGSINPFGGSVDFSDGVQVLLAAMPTLLDLPIQIINERGTFGSPSAPEKSPFDSRPDSSRMFTSQMNTVSEKISKALNELGGGNDAKAGKIMGVETSVTPGTIQTLISATTGGLGSFVEQVGSSVIAMTGDDKDLKANKIPFLNKFYGEVDESANIRGAGDRMREVKKLAEEVKAQQKIGLDPELDKDEERLIGLASMQEKYQKFQTQLRKKEIEIIKDEKLTEPEKKLQRRQIQMERDKLATDVNRDYLKSLK